MTCVLDLQLCLDNQRLIGGIATKKNSHARGKQLLYRYIHMVGLGMIDQEILICIVIRNQFMQIAFHYF